MKITEYPEVSTSQADDKFIISTADGTKSIKSENVRINGIPEEFTIIPFEEDPAILHNSHFRGKNLGSEITDEQIQSIRNGTFDDIWVGDYWEINNIKWRVAALNFYTTEQQTELRNPVKTVTLFPDAALTTKVWNTNASANIDKWAIDFNNYLKNTILPTYVPSTISKYLKPVRLLLPNKSLYNSSDRSSISNSTNNFSIFAPFPENISASFTSLSNLLVKAGTNKRSEEDTLPLFKLTKRYIAAEVAYAYFTCISVDGIYPVVIGRQGDCGLQQQSATNGVRPFVVIG